MKNLEVEEAKEKRKAIQKKQLADERKKYVISMIEKDAKKDFEMERDEKALLEACDSDDGDPDVEFEGNFKNKNSRKPPKNIRRSCTLTPFFFSSYRLQEVSNYNFGFIFQFRSQNPFEIWVEHLTPLLTI